MENARKSTRLSAFLSSIAPALTAASIAVRTGDELQRQGLTIRFAGFALLAAATIGVPAAYAHHSTSAFDANTRVVLTGKVTEVKWTNPHTYILIDVREDGVTRNWSIISGTPQLNVRNGWKRDDVKAGDQVSATVHPDRRGRPMGILRNIKLADGRTIAGPREFLQVPKTE